MSRLINISAHIRSIIMYYYYFTKYFWLWNVWKCWKSYNPTDSSTVRCTQSFVLSMCNAHQKLITLHIFGICRYVWNMRTVSNFNGKMHHTQTKFTNICRRPNNAVLRLYGLASRLHKFIRDGVTHMNNSIFIRAYVPKSRILIFEFICRDAKGWNGVTFLLPKCDYMISNGFAG